MQTRHEVKERLGVVDHAGWKQERSSVFLSWIREERQETDRRLGPCSCRDSSGAALYGGKGIATHRQTLSPQSYPQTQC